MSGDWIHTGNGQRLMALLDNLGRRVGGLSHELKRYNDSAESEGEDGPQAELDAAAAHITELREAKAQMTVAFAKTLGINLPDDPLDGYPAIMATALSELEKLEQIRDDSGEIADAFYSRLDLVADDLEGRDFSLEYVLRLENAGRLLGINVWDYWAENFNGRALDRLKALKDSATEG